MKKNSARIYNNKRIRKKILIVYNEIPSTFSGGNIRVYNFCKYLSLNNDVTILTVPKTETEKIPIIASCKIIIPRYHCNDFKGFSRIGNLIDHVYCRILRLFDFKNPSLIKIHKYHIFILRRELLRILKYNDYDIIQIEHSYMGNILKNISCKARKILSFHNMHSEMVSQEKRQQMLNYESGLSKTYDYAICCSDKDKESVRKAGFKGVFVVNNGSDIISLKKSNDSQKSSINQYPSLLFLSDLTYPPNFEAISYFIKTIYPLLKHKLALNIIGKYNDAELRKIAEMTRNNPTINVKGFVKDIAPYMKNSIVICPILTGGGTRIKILTAMSYGVPVISTTKGAEGIHYTPRKDILIANTPIAFAQSIEKLINNPKLRNTLGNNGLTLVTKKYYWKKIMESYNDELDTIL